MDEITGAVAAGGKMTLKTIYAGRAGNTTGISK
jgi:hypothetical protein